MEDGERGQEGTRQLVSGLTSMPRKPRRSDGRSGNMLLTVTLQGDDGK